MDVLSVGDWIQVTIACTAVAASVVALSIAYVDRRNTRQLAAKEWRRQVLIFELDYARQLAALNHDHSPHMFDAERGFDWAHERQGLIAVLRHRLPYQSVKGEYLRDKAIYETQEAIDAILAELNEI